MEERNAEDNRNGDEKNDSKGTKRKKKIIFLVSGIVALIVLLLILAYFLLPKPSEIEWLSNKMIALYIAIGLIAAGVGAWFILRKTLRTRLKMQKVMKLDPDINDWLIIFNWTPKILYAPTIAASLFAAVLMYLNEINLWFFGSVPGVVIGGILV